MAEEITARVHSKEELHHAKRTTEILFGSSFEEFKTLSNTQIEDAFDSDVTFNISKNFFSGDTDVVSLLGEKAAVFPSKGEARKNIQGNGVSINKEKVTALDFKLNEFKKMWLFSNPLVLLDLPLTIDIEKGL